MLSKFSVRKPMTVVVAVVAIIILGVVSFSKMTTDLLPSIDLPYAVVMTTNIGSTPEEIELKVTKPIEQSMATLSNIKDIRSISRENVSVVILEFSDSTNMDYITVDMREKLDMLGAYWDDSVGTPTIMKLNPDMLPVSVLALDVNNMKMAEISEFADSTVIPALEGVEGIASVSANGLIEENVNVVINQKKIDKINKKLKESVESQMSDAEKKLADAQSELKSGKEEITNQTNQFTQGILDAQQAISDGKMELLKTEMTLEQQEVELKKKEAELKASEEELKKKEEEAKETEKSLKQSEATLGVAKAELEKQEAALQAQIEVAGETEKAELEVALGAIQEQKKVIESSLDKVKEGKKQLEEGKKQLESAKAQLNEGKKQLEEVKSKISQGKKQIESGKSELKRKEAELEKQKQQVEDQLNDAMENIKEGEKELTTQTDSLESQKETAIESANVSDTITADMISQILQAQNFSMPAGYVSEDGVDYLVRVGDKIQNQKEMEELVLFDPGMEDMDPIRLKDVADIFTVDNSESTYAKVNGNDAVIFSLQKQTTYSTSEVADNIEKKINLLKKQNPEIHVTSLMDQGMYIEIVVDSVLNNLIWGGILAVIILFLFLWDIKPTIIIACSIPLSVVFAIVLMYFSGVTLNIISLSGLAVGVGMLVDNSVVVIENIYRLRSKGISAIKAAVSGAVQVAGAITSSTLTTVCVFLPIVFVEGITKQLFVDMALTITYSLLASLIVALTLVPAMAANMLKKTKEKKHRLLNWVIAGYEMVLKMTLRFKPVVLLLVIALMVLSVKGALARGTAFMPDMDSTQVSVSITMPEDATFKDSVEMADAVMERVRQIEDIETVGASIGGGSMMSSNSENNNISMYAILKEEKKQDSKTIASKIEEVCADLPCEVSASGSNMDMGALGGAGISIQVYANEISTLMKTSQELADIIAEVEGIAQVGNGIEDPTPEIKITINKKKAILEGLTVAQAYMELQARLANQSSATALSSNGTEYDVIVKGNEQSKLTPEEIRKYVFEVKGKDGTKKEVKLTDIAVVSNAQSLSSINREQQKRYLTVSATLKDGYNIGLVSQDVEKAVEQYQVPEGCEIKFAGENETITEALDQLMQMMLLGVVLIYLIMVAQFQSLLSPFIVMFTIPLAFTGGFLGLYFTHKEISVVAMIGLIMLAGIVVNNGIVLVDYINQLRREGMEKKEAIIEAGKTRMRPIFMTALTTILGLSTMALGMGMGADMVQPMAIVTIGGLLYATITTLFVIPVLYDLVNRRKMKVIEEDELEIVRDEELF